MSDFLRVLSRSTKFDAPSANIKGGPRDFFQSKKSTNDSTSASSSTPVKTVAALDFFGTNTPKPSAPSTSPASSSSTTTKSSQKKANQKKRSREEEEETKEAAEDSDEEDGDDDAEEAEEEDDDNMVDDGGNDLDDEEAENDDDEDADGNGVQLFNRSSASMDDDNDDNDDASDEDQSASAVAKRLKKFRREAGIHVQGSDIPAPFSQFEELKSDKFKVPEYMIQNLMRSIKDGGSGYEKPTPIQQQAVPIMLKGRELLACAQTGSGKTASFVIPILASLKRPEKGAIRALVLSPTRELAEQTHRTFNTIARGRKFKIFHLNKANANSNAFGENSNANRDILITTPMRLVHLIEKEGIDLSHVEYLVMDEADRLFELGFLEQVDTILAACTHPSLKKALFSATMEQGVELLAKTVLRDPIRLNIGARNSATNSIKQELKFVGSEEGKLLALRQMLQAGIAIPALLFVQSKERAKQLYQELIFESISVDVIHAERTQHQRSESIRKFRAGSIWVLICTDLMARGIDFIGVNTVINYDFPQSSVSYIHRVGRTGRAGRSGHAITFFTEADKPLLPNIAKLVQQSGSEVPDWMLKMHKIGTKKAKKLKDQAPARQPIAPSSKNSASNKKARDRKKKRKLANGKAESSE